MRCLAGIPLTLDFEFDSAKELLQLATHDILSVRAASTELALTGMGDVKPLEGSRVGFRLRVGKARVEFRVYQELRVLAVQRIFYRQQGYGTKGRSRR